MITTRNFPTVGIIWNAPSNWRWKIQHWRGADGSSGRILLEGYIWHLFGCLIWITWTWRVQRSTRPLVREGCTFGEGILACHRNALCIDYQQDLSIRGFLLWHFQKHMLLRFQQTNLHMVWCSYEINTVSLSCWSNKACRGFRIDPVGISQAGVASWLVCASVDGLLCNLVKPHW